MEPSSLESARRKADPPWPRTGIIRHGASIGFRNEILDLFASFEASSRTPPAGLLLRTLVLPWSLRLRCRDVRALASGLYGYRERPDPSTHICTGTYPLAARF